MPTLKTPFFGSAYTSRSTNLADQQLINLYPEIVETRSGKNVGAFYGCPGLTLEATIGVGPIRPGGMELLNGSLYVVSGPSLYQVSSSFVPTLVGAIDMSSVGVSMIVNGNQLAIFTATNGYLVPGGDGLNGGTILDGGLGYAIGDTINLVGNDGQTTATAILTVTSVGALGLTGGVPITPGINYAIGDTINLTAVGGTQISPAQIQVSNVGVGGGLVSFNVPVPGSFSVPPVSFTQASTSGSGSGMTIGSLTFTGGAVTGFSVSQPGAFPIQPSGFTQASTSGSGVGFTLTLPTYTVFVGIIPIALPYTPSGDYPISATYCDGFGLIDQPGTNQIWQSNELDFSVWDGLNFASASGDPDNVIALNQIHREVFVFKQFDTELWVNAGLPGFVFERLTNVFIEAGVVAQLSVAKLGETLCFLAQNDQGQGVVVQIQGYNPVRISTHAIEHAIQEYSTISDAIGFAYQQEGHEFYVLIFPTGNATWVYDATASALAGAPMWHQRAAFSNGQFLRHWANCHVYAYGLCLIGDYRNGNGNIYSFNLDVLLDNGVQRKWLRSWRALPQPSLDPVRFSELSIDMQTGIGVPVGTAPQVMLRWSDDGGHNWGTQLQDLAGAPGQTSWRVRFDRLGSTRRNSGLDRIFELSSADQFPAALISADLR